MDLAIYIYKYIYIYIAKCVLLQWCTPALYYSVRGQSVCSAADNALFEFGYLLQWNADTRMRFTAVSVAKVFADFAVPRTIHYLSLDVEGFESKILQALP